MRRILIGATVGLIGCLGTLVLLGNPASAATLAGNLTPGTTGSSGWETNSTNNDPGGAENFTLAQSATIDGLGFWYAYRTFGGLTFDQAITRVDWFVFSDSDATDGSFGLPSTQITAGSVLGTALSYTNLGLSVPSNPSSNDLIAAEFSIPDLALAAGDYWVSYSIIRTGGAGQVFWWQSASGDGLDAAFSETLLIWETPYQTNAPNRMFKVVGDINPVPVPAALPLLLSALGLFGFMGWRRKKAAAA